MSKTLQETVQNADAASQNPDFQQKVSQYGMRTIMEAVRDNRGGAAEKIAKRSGESVNEVRSGMDLQLKVIDEQFGGDFNKYNEWLHRAGQNPEYANQDFTKIMTDIRHKGLPPLQTAQNPASGNTPASSSIPSPSTSSAQQPGGMEQEPHKTKLPDMGDRHRPTDILGSMTSEEFKKFLDSEFGNGDGKIGRFGFLDKLVDALFNNAQSSSAGPPLMQKVGQRGIDPDLIMDEIPRAYNDQTGKFEPIRPAMDPSIMFPSGPA